MGRRLILYSIPHVYYILYKRVIFDTDIEYTTPNINIFMDVKSIVFNCTIMSIWYLTKNKYYVYFFIGKILCV